MSWHFSGSERKEGSQTFVWLLIVAAIVGLLMVGGINGLSGHKRENGKRLEQIKKQNGRRLPRLHLTIRFSRSRPRLVGSAATAAAARMR